MNKIRTSILSETNIDKIHVIVRPSLHNRYVRGQSKSSYDLSSSFFRKHPQVYSQKSTKWMFCRDYFSPYEWKEQVKGEYHKGDDDSSLRTTFPIGIGKHGENLEMFPHLIGMAIQQHHGELPTPLLDVSYDIEMPLYCACRTNWDCDGKLFVISIKDGDCYSINDFETTPLYIHNIITTHNRLKKQKGMFLKTLSWVRDDSIAYNNPGLAFGDISLSFNTEIEEYIIPKENKEKILFNLATVINPEISLHNYFGNL